MFRLGWRKGCWRRRGRSSIYEAQGVLVCVDKSEAGGREGLKGGEGEDNEGGLGRRQLGRGRVWEEVEDRGVDEPGLGELWEDVVEEELEGDLAEDEALRSIRWR